MVVFAPTDNARRGEIPRQARDDSFSFFVVYYEQRDKMLVLRFPVFEIADQQDCHGRAN